MHEDEEHPPRYIGVAFEFLCKISSSELLVDYSDLYGNVFKDEKWLYVDSLESLTDEFLFSLTATQVVTILAVTVGSDAHDPSRVGQYAPQAMQILKDIFGHVCTYENRQPVFHKL